MTTDEIEAAKEARRAALRAEIDSLKEILAILQECLGLLEEQMKKLEEDIIDVEIDYDLSVNGTWVGTNYKEADTTKSKLHKALHSYDGEMENLKEQIDVAITKIEEEIRKKEAELASI